MPVAAAPRLAAALILAATVAGAAPHGQSVSFDASPTAAESAALKQAIGNDYGTMAPFTLAHADLNDDGRPDLIARADSDGACGSQGCATYALLATAQGFSTQAITLQADYGPVEILPGVDHGMHELRFSDGDHIFRWSGKSYR